MSHYDRGLVLVTGAFGGLGTAIVERLTRDGAEVLATDRRAADAAAWLAGFDAAQRARIEAVALDITKEAEVETLRERLAAEGRHVAFLINNAGVTGAGAPWTMAAKTFDIVMRVNVTGSFLLTRAFCAAMRERGFGRIVNFASLYAYDPGPGQAPYAAAKAGVVGYTHSIAKDLAPFGVTCNVIAPGLIWHERLRGVLPDAEFEEMQQRTPMKRSGTPAEIAGVVSFLLSDDAGYLTGQTLHVNGGTYMSA
ncbi:MAG TPA: SDR family NAD(P)-dependent oxidoreductase [Gammaproteobacteria bacterium]|nr:SDR family NAD(P)-dependent oxidoreductase [Gammaproteobacteria bacterium]